MKGFWRTMESVLSVMLLMGFLLFLGGSYLTRAGETDMSPVGYGVLKELDTSGNLRSYAASGDYSSINSKIDIPGYNHSVEICDYSGDCVGEYPEWESVIASNYLISGYNDYEPFMIKLYMWR